MTTFCFFYGINLSFTIYSLTDNLSKTLQKENMPAIEGKSIAMKTVETLENMRNEEAANNFYQTTLAKASKMKFVGTPVMTRKSPWNRNLILRPLTERKGSAAQATRLLTNSMGDS